MTIQEFIRSRDYPRTWKHRLTQFLAVMFVLHLIIGLLFIYYPPWREGFLDWIVQNNKEYFIDYLNWLLENGHAGPRQGDDHLPDESKTIEYIMLSVTEPGHPKIYLDLIGPK